MLTLGAENGGVWLDCRGEGGDRNKKERGRGGTYNIVTLDAICFSPGAHDEGVVVRNDGDDINTLGFELVEVVDVAGKMGGGAGGGEGAGHGEEDDFLAGEFWGGGNTASEI